MASTEKNASTKSSDFHYGQWFPLKGMTFAKRNGFREKEQLPLPAIVSIKMNALKEMTYTKKNDFH